MNETGVILIGHGSRLPEAADALVKIAESLSCLIGRTVDYAFMQFARPSIDETVARLAESAPAKIILLPVFLTKGQHVLDDLPSALKEIGAKHKKIDFLLGRPIGPDHRLVEIVHDRLMEMTDLPLTGAQIAATSFRMIAAGSDLPLDECERQVAARIVHTTGDRSLGRSLVFSTGAIDAGIRALRGDCAIVTDVRMVKAGISLSLVDEERVLSGLELIDGAEQEKDFATRTAAGVNSALTRCPDALIAIGNAPTALMEVCRLLDEGSIRPPLVIGVPVGFVGAAEAKEVLARRPVDFITLPGTRGGSPIAATIVNALAELAFNEREKPEIDL